MEGLGREALSELTVGLDGTCADRVVLQTPYPAKPAAPRAMVQTMALAPESLSGKAGFE